MRVWRRGPTAIEIPSDSSHELVLRLWNLGTKEEALKDGWTRIHFDYLRGEPILAVEGKDLETAHKAFLWAFEENQVMPNRVFVHALHEQVDRMLEGQEVDIFYRYGRVTQSNVAKWRSG